MKRISGNHRQTGLKDRKINAPNLAVTWRPQNNLRRRGPDVPAARVYGERIWPVLRVMYLCALDWWRRKPLCIVQKYMRIDLISLIPWSISKPVYTSIRPALPLPPSFALYFSPYEWKKCIYNHQPSWNCREQMLTLSLVRFLVFMTFTLQGINARGWRDTGGTIILEEAWTTLDLLFQVGWLHLSSYLPAQKKN